MYIIPKTLTDERTGVRIVKIETLCFSGKGLTKSEGESSGKSSGFVIDEASIRDCLVENVNKERSAKGL